mmetsp:Transcript_28441/g.91818  ORF Transcript_28441/g.91818 Transcript_28441/m.91818 type:complete len:211 (-) Transcript_28441:68-700(-)
MPRRHGGDEPLLGGGRRCAVRGRVGPDPAALGGGQRLRCSSRPSPSGRGKPHRRQPGGNDAVALGRRVGARRGGGGAAGGRRGQGRTRRVWGDAGGRSAHTQPGAAGRRAGGARCDARREGRGGFLHPTPHPGQSRPQAAPAGPGAWHGSGQAAADCSLVRPPVHRRQVQGSRGERGSGAAPRRCSGGIGCCAAAIAAPARLRAEPAASA